MAQLILFTGDLNSAKGEVIRLQKKLTTVGGGSGLDVQISDHHSGLLFSIVKDGESYELLPGTARIRVNTKIVSDSHRLSPLDRIEWTGGVATFVSRLDLKGTSGEEQRIEVRWQDFLASLESYLQSEDQWQEGLAQALNNLVEMAGAESGYLLKENNKDAGWELVARTGSLQGRELISNTILQECVQRREPVHVESMIGHPWSGAASVIQARIFSAACLPLSIGGRVFGAVFLATSSPGRVIRKHVLPELAVLASQASLLLAARRELGSVMKENARLRSLIPSDSPVTSAPYLSRAEKLAKTPLDLLIVGETGSGKEVVAQEIHAWSGRKKIVAVNCAAIPSTLLEATLFGFEKGAFTGAVRSQIGKFEQASGGTLFLDEIGDLSADLQAKLLRVLQERQVEPIGASQPRPIDVRILSATHQNLEQAVQKGRFRQDLFFRLAGATVKVPSLRERTDEIVPLAEGFLKEQGLDLGFSIEAQEKLLNYPWPGNVRELKQVILRAGWLCESGIIDASDLEISDTVPSSVSHQTTSATMTQRHDSLQDAQMAFTRDYILQELRSCQGNRAEAASRLRVSERTLYRLLNKIESVDNQERAP